MQYRAAIVLALIGTSAYAGQYGGALGVSTDNVFRGLSLNAGQPSPQADIYYAAPHWSIGAAAEEVRRGIEYRAGIELSTYASIAQPLPHDWSTSVGVRHYDYPGNRQRARYAYDELSANLSWQGRVAATIAASPDSYASALPVAGRPRYGRGAAFCYEFSASQPLPRGFAVDVGAGYDDLSREIGSGYTYGSAGVQLAWHALTWDLRYVATDRAARSLTSGEAANHWVLSLLWLF